MLLFYILFETIREILLTIIIMLSKDEYFDFIIMLITFVIN
jgi:hypothetical protein